MNGSSHGGQHDVKLSGELFITSERRTRWQYTMDVAQVASWILIPLVLLGLGQCYQSAETAKANALKASEEARAAAAASQANVYRDAAEERENTLVQIEASRAASERSATVRSYVDLLLEDDERSRQLAVIGLAETVNGPVIDKLLSVVQEGNDAAAIEAQEQVDRIAKMPSTATVSVTPRRGAWNGVGLPSFVVRLEVFGRRQGQTSWVRIDRATASMKDVGTVRLEELPISSFSSLRLELSCEQDSEPFWVKNVAVAQDKDADPIQESEEWSPDPNMPSCALANGPRFGAIQYEVDFD